MELIIAGDFSPTGNVMSSFIRGDIKALFGDVPEVLREADRVLVNLECALTIADTAIAKIGPNLKGAPECARVLRDIGVTDCALSNNHIFDFGKQGLTDTIKYLNEQDLSFTGIGQNDTDSRRALVLHMGEKKITVIAVCEHEYSYALPDRMGANPYDPYDTMEDIQKARASSEYVIVLYHGGKEYCRYPSPRLHKLCRAMVKNGADIVLCQHSHCIGCYENFEGAHILYGQGNFHFVKESPHDGWYNGLLIKLSFENTCDISFIPVVMTKSGIDLAKGDEQAAILSAFEQRNIELKNGQWEEGWEKFCTGVQKMYDLVITEALTQTAPERQNEQFSHYLDCEAHTDVWRTLNKTCHHANEPV